MTVVEGPLVLMTVSLLVLLLPILLGVPIVYSIALSSILIMVLLVGLSFIRSCVSILGTGPHYRRFRGLKHPMRDSIAVQSHARPYDTTAAAAIAHDVASLFSPASGSNGTVERPPVVPPVLYRYNAVTVYETGAT